MTTINISLTGHRPQKLGGFDISTNNYLLLQQDLEIYIEKNLAVHQKVIGHSGLALGADTIWSKAILAMRKKYPNRVELHAHIPMLEQSSVWFNKTDIDFWQEQVDTADHKTVYGSLADIPQDKRGRESGRLLDVRNHGMLDSGDVLLALWDGTTSGTGNAVKYAETTSLTTIIVHPEVYFKK